MPNISDQMIKFLLVGSTMCRWHNACCLARQGFATVRRIVEDIFDIAYSYTYVATIFTIYSTFLALVLLLAHSSEHTCH